MGKRFVKVASLSELPRGSTKSIDIDGVPIMLCNVEGELYAVHDECTHERYPLSDGTLQGHAVTCSLHGARFDVRSGEVLALPAYEELETYEVGIDGEDVLVALD